MANTNESLITILEKVKSRISDHSDMVWTRYSEASELRNELEFFIKEISKENLKAHDDINDLFLPTGSLQEHAISAFCYYNSNSSYRDIKIRFNYHFTINFKDCCYPSKPNHETSVSAFISVCRICPGFFPG